MWDILSGEDQLVAEPMARPGSRSLLYPHIPTSLPLTTYCLQQLGSDGSLFFVLNYACIAIHCGGNGRPHIGRPVCEVRELAWA